MALLYDDPGRVIAAGMDVYFVWTLMNPDGTVDDLATWTATFEIFDVDHVSQVRYESSGGLINVGRWDSLTSAGFYNIYAGLPKAITSALTDWGDGYFNVDLIDPMGHVSYRIRGPIALERGSTHV